MATRKASSPALAASTSETIQLDLSVASTRIRKHGIEFRTTEPIKVWTEMTVTLRDPVDGQEVVATGVVVDCRGDRHQGYTTSVVFMELAPLAQARLSLMAYSNLA